MKTVYDENGNAHMLDGVDAREYLATGRFFEKCPVKSEPVELVEPVEPPEEVKESVTPKPKRRVKKGE